MNLLRLIILVIAVWTLVSFVRRYLQRPSPKSEAPPRISNMVRCERCGLHVLETEALKKGTQYYCSPQHRDGITRS